MVEGSNEDKATKGLIECERKNVPNTFRGTLASEEEFFFACL